MDGSTFMDSLMKDVEELGKPFGGRFGRFGQKDQADPPAYTGRLVDIVTGAARVQKDAQRESLLDLVVKGVSR